MTYNSASVLPGLLDSLPAGLEGVKQFETIVVDNDSADNSVDTALAHAIRPRIIRMGRNAGYAAAINAAAATVRPDADLLILNPDVRLLPGAASLLVDRLTDSSVGVAVPRILAEDGTTRLVTAAGTLPHDGMDGRHSGRNVGCPYRYGRDDQRSSDLR